MSLIYHTQEPRNVKSSYNPLDNVFFSINNTGRKMILGSLRLEGVLDVKDNGLNPITTDVIAFNPRVGAHGLIESWQIDNANGMLENISNDYQRYISMVNCASLSDSDLNSAKHRCELMATCMQETNAIMIGPKLVGDATTFDNKVDFSFKPVVCLNRPMPGSDSTYSFDKYGFINVAMNMSANLKFLVGDTSDLSYTLSDLKLTYRTVPEDGKHEPVMLRRVIALKSTVDSDLANISSKVSGVCDSMIWSVLPASKDSVNSSDSMALENVPGLDSVQYIWNSSLNAYISYVIDDPTEVLKRGIEAISSSGHNSATHQQLAQNNGWLGGLGFGEMVDLSKQNFNIQLQTGSNGRGISNTGTLNVYRFFSSQVSL